MKESGSNPVAVSEEVEARTPSPIMTAKRAQNLARKALKDPDGPIRAALEHINARITDAAQIGLSRVVNPLADFPGYAPDHEQAIRKALARKGYQVEDREPGDGAQPEVTVSW